MPAVGLLVSSSATFPDVDATVPSNSTATVPAVPAVGLLVSSSATFPDVDATVPSNSTATVPAVPADVSLLDSVTFPDVVALVLPNSTATVPAVPVAVDVTLDAITLQLASDTAKEMALSATTNIPSTAPAPPLAACNKVSIDTAATAPLATTAPPDPSTPAAITTCAVGPACTSTPVHAATATRATTSSSELDACANSISPDQAGPSPVLDLHAVSTANISPVDRKLHGKHARHDTDSSDDSSADGSFLSHHPLRRAPGPQPALTAISEEQPGTNNGGDTDGNDTITAHNMDKAPAACTSDDDDDTFTHVTSSAKPSQPRLSLERPKSTASRSFFGVVMPGNSDLVQTVFSHMESPRLARKDHNGAKSKRDKRAAVAEAASKDRREFQIARAAAVTASATTAPLAAPTAAPPTAPTATTRPKGTSWVNPNHANPAAIRPFSAIRAEANANRTAAPAVTKPAAPATITKAAPTTGANRTPLGTRATAASGTSTAAAPTTSSSATAAKPSYASAAAPKQPSTVAQPPAGHSNNLQPAPAAAAAADSAGASRKDTRPEACEAQSRQQSAPVAGPAASTKLGYKGKQPRKGPRAPHDSTWHRRRNALTEPTESPSSPPSADSSAMNSSHRSASDQHEGETRIRRAHKEHLPGGTTTLHVLTCSNCNIGPFDNEEEVYQHFLDFHAIDGECIVDEKFLAQHGLESCPACRQLFRSGQVHASTNNKCRMATYLASSQFAQTRKAAALNVMSPDRICSLQVDTEIIDPDTFFSKAVGFTADIHNNTDLRHKLRMAVILAVHAIKCAGSNYEQITAAWLYLLQLPALVLPAKTKHTEISRRMALALEGNTAELVELRTQKLSLRRAAAVTRIDDDAAAAQAATKIMHATGNLSKAASRLLDPTSLLQHSDPNVAEQISNLLIYDPGCPQPAQLPWPDAKRRADNAAYDSSSDSYSSLSDEEPLITADVIPELTKDSVLAALQHSPKKSSPGITGWSTELIQILAETPQGCDAVHFICNKLYSDDVPAVISDGIHRQVLVTLTKGAKPGVRPILMADSWLRLVEATVARMSPSLTHTLAPLQMAVGVASGSEHIIHLARAAFNASSDNILVQTDIKNAYGSIHRRAIFEGVRTHCPKDTYMVLRQYLNLHMRKPSTYLANDGTIGKYNQGVAQGSPLSMLLFCCTIHQALTITAEAVKRERPGAPMLITSYADDSIFIGPPGVVFDAIEHFKDLVAQIGLELQPAKSTVLAPPGLKDRVKAYTQQYEFPDPVTCVDILGAPVGTPDEEKRALDEAINSEFFDKLALMEDPQCQLLLLRQSILSKYTYFARCVPPEVAEEPFNRLNTLIGKALTNIIGHRHTTKQTAYTASLPFTLGGLGLTDLELISGAAYYASAGYALQYWSTHLGKDHYIIDSWADPSTVSGRHLNNAIHYLRSATAEYNKGKIVPKRGTTSEIDKANPEARIQTPLPPTLPLSPKTLLNSNASKFKFKKLQSELTHVINVTRFRDIWRIIDRDNLFQRTVFISNTVPSASIWLQVTPDNKRFLMGAAEFQISLQMYFGLHGDIDHTLGLTSEFGPRPICPCSAACYFDSPRHPDTPKATYEHMISCLAEDAYTRRHMSLTNVCIDAVSSTGIKAIPEARATKDQTSVMGRDHGHLTQKRFDLSVPSVGDQFKMLQCDVTVTTHLPGNQNRALAASRNALVLANMAARTKLGKYRDYIYPDTEAIVPLVFETSGVIHPNVNQFLYTIGRICNHATPIDANASAPTFSRYWLAALSCTVHVETARALIRIARTARNVAGRHAASDDMDLPQTASGNHAHQQYSSAHDEDANPESDQDRRDPAQPDLLNL